MEVPLKPQEMKKYLLLFTITFIISCNNEPTILTHQNEVSTADQVLYEMASTYLFALPPTAEDDAHPLSEKLVKLGRELYFEKALSLDKKVSCNTCHPLDNYGVDNLSLSEGVGGKKGVRNSPSTYNAALHLAQFWDGRAKDVEAQVEGPLLNPNEMAMPSKKAVVRRIRQLPKYSLLFAEAYGGDALVTYPKIAQAIGGFERTLMTPSRLDDYLKGDLSVLSGTEKRGLKKMLDYGCIPCHSGSTMGGAMYQKFGLFDDYQRFTKSVQHDFGKMSLSDLPADKDVFKVPSLRNVTQTAPYFHDGSVAKIEDAVQIMANLQLGRTLSEQDVRDIVDFLGVSADWGKK